MADFTLAKPNIDDKKILTKEEQTQVLDALTKQGCRLIHCEIKPVKNDYFDDHYRGSVEYTPKCRNYSYHIVHIPDGTTIKDTNFTQRVPNNPAIIGKNLTFIDCNLVNNVIDPSWTVKWCNNSQIDIEAREAKEAADLLAEKGEI
jgi:hypothetical protein